MSLSAPSQTVVVRFERMTHGSRAVGRLDDGRVVLALGAAPDELALVRITREHKTYVEGVVDQVLEPSIHRREPPCPHAKSGECGGCPWQHLTEAAQRSEKEAIVCREVERVAPEATVRPIRSDVPPFGYRRRARLGYRDSVLGYRRPAQRRIFDLTCCPVLDPALEAALPRIREAVSGGGSGNIDILVQPDGQVVYGPDATPFAQASEGGESCLIDLVLEAFPSDLGRICELFSGSGTFTIPLLNRGHSVSAWEIDRKALKRLRRVAPAADVHRADLLNESTPLDLGRFEGVLLDPPRGGAAVCMEAIANTGAHIVVYVSCAPMTLCRDLQMLRDRGYRVDWVQPVDAFPQTHHIECVTVLTRTNP
jgi:23S rRNA (uracil1939-C5)-methyltransferase